MKKLFGNKVIGFVATRYFSYVLQFLNSLFVAWSLGPFYMGVWGFISMIMQYMAFGNLGVDISLNVTLSTGDFKDVERQKRFVSNALFATIITSTIYLFVAVGLVLSGVHFFEKYLFTRYLFPLVLISCFNYFNILFLNVFRAHSIFMPISVFQTLVQLVQLPLFLFFKDTDLINAILAAQLLAHVFSFLLFYMQMPFPLKFKTDWGVVKELFTRGVSLLVYNITFYLIMLSSRSLVSFFYPVETMGLFTFAANIASALIVGLSSLDFVLFPKMLNRLGKEELNASTKQSFNDLRYLYTVLAFIVILVGLLCYPILLMFFNAYSSTIVIFTLLAMSQLIISSGFGYATMIISRGKELYLVKHGIISVIINVFLGSVLVYFLHVPYEALAFLLVLAFVYYDIQVVKLGRNLLGLESTIPHVLKEMFPLSTLIPLLVMLVGLLMGNQLLFNLIALVIFILLNRKGYYLFKKYLDILFNRPSAVNISGD